MTARTPQRQQLMQVLGPVVSALGFDLEDVSVTAAGRRSLIRITVDGDDGIDLDGVADVAHAISETLDDESTGQAAFAGPYVLEVSSPGVDRPLTEARHWRRAIGRLVSCTSTDAASARSITGRITATDDQQVTIEVEGVEEQFGWSQLGPGRIQVEFSRPGQPRLVEDELAEDDLAEDDLAEDELAEDELPAAEDDALPDEEEI